MNTGGWLRLNGTLCSYRIRQTLSKAVTLPNKAKLEITDYFITFPSHASAGRAILGPVPRVFW